VFLLAVLRRASADSTYRVLKFSGLEMFSAALIAFIASGGFSAVRAGSFHIAVRKETVACRAVSDFYNFRVNITFFNQRAYNVKGPVVILRIIRCPESIEKNSKLLKSFIKVFMIYLYKFFRGDPKLFSVYGNRSAMSIRAANKGNIPPFLFQGAGKNISGHIGPEVPDMRLAVGIGQATCDKYGFTG
jgi:hypothetical protein